MFSPPFRFALHSVVPLVTRWNRILSFSLPLRIESLAESI